VIGATGNQGGVIIDHLLAAGREFAVRGLTRTPDSEAARALGEREVNIRRGDLNDKEHSSSEALSISEGIHI
jgi:uncharacterized protein YbjT (DUF2867 family)